MRQIGQTHPEAAARSVSALTAELEKFAENDYELNALIVEALADLKAVDSMPAIERAYAAGRVDDTIIGDLEDARILMGLKATRDQPRPRLSAIRNSFSDDGFDEQEDGDNGENGEYVEPRKPVEYLNGSPPDSPWPAEDNRTAKAKAKAKAKRKSQKQSRKKNRQGKIKEIAGRVARLPRIGSCGRPRQRIWIPVAEKGPYPQESRIENQKSRMLGLHSPDR